MIDRVIEKKFSRAAPLYDKVSFLQKRLNERLFRYIEFNMIPCSILDIGVATANSFALLNKRRLDIDFFGCDISFEMLMCARKKFSKNLFLTQSDGEYLPFKDNSFNIIASNATLQWAKDLYKVFCETHRVLKEDGKFYFTIFGPKTLQELRHSFDMAYSIVGASPKRHVRTFKAKDEIVDLLRKACFSAIELDVSYEEELFSDAFSLIRWLKSIGSGMAKDTNLTGLWGKRLFLNMDSLYEENFRYGDNIKATFEVFFVRADKQR